MTTQQLSITSKAIITQGGVSVQSGSLLNKFWVVIRDYGVFFYLIYTIFAWLKVLNYIFGHTFFHNEAKSFKSILLAIFVFFILQGFLIFGNAAIAKNVDCFANCDGKAVVDYLTIPFTVFIDVWNAIPYTIKTVGNLSNG